MSKLKERLKDVTVEWKSLEEIATIGTGSHDTKDAVEDGKYMFYARGIKPLKLNSYDFDENAIITAGDGVGVGKVFHWVEGKYALHQRAYRIVPNNYVNSRYIYHYFVARFYDYIKIYSVHSSVTSLRKPMFLKFPVQIPYPNDLKKSLEIQQEIVRVLDSLIEKKKSITAALTVEIGSRKEQYEYYREKLFTIENSNAKKIPLGDETLGKFTRGSGLQKKDFTDNGLGCIHYGQIYTYYGTSATKTKSFVSLEFAQKARKAKKGNLVIATTSENDVDVCKAVAWLGNEDIAISSDACFYSHNLHPKYVAYYFQTEQFQKQKRKFITGTKVRRVNVSDLEKILIPVPKLQEQNSIVKLLDEYEIAIKSIEKELNNEIDLRNKQFEYYRNLLLTLSKVN